MTTDTAKTEAEEQAEFEATIEGVTDKAARVIHHIVEDSLHPSHQTSMPDVATPLPELAERFARLDVAIREHAEEMKGERKERREIAGQLKERLAEGGYLGDQQLTIPGFRGYEEFTFAADTEEVSIMVESGDTKTATKLKVGRKRTKGWRR